MVRDVFNEASEATKWLVALAFMMPIFGSVMGYITFAFDSLVFLDKLSFASAATASLLYAVALSAGSVSYYTGWPNMRLGYQKQIGLLAYFWSLFYCFTLLALYPETYITGISTQLWTADIIFGGGAMIIFTAMAVINSKSVAPLFHLETIKFVLGLGFVAYAFLAIRAILIEFDIWLLWLENLEGYPPGRMVLTVIAISVLLLRLSIPIHRSLKIRS